MTMRLAVGGLPGGYGKRPDFLDAVRCFLIHVPNQCDAEVTFDANPKVSSAWHPIICRSSQNDIPVGITTQVLKALRKTTVALMVGTKRPRLGFP